MSKITILLTFVLLCIFQPVAWGREHIGYPGFTEEEYKEYQFPYQLSFGVNLGYPWVEVDNSNDETSSAYENMAAGITFRYCMLNWLFVGANIDYTLITPEDMDNTRLHFLSIMPTLEFRYPLYGSGTNESHPQAFLYFAPSAGIDIPHASEVDGNINEKPSFAFTLNVGLEFFVSQKVSVQVEGGWFFKEYRYEFNTNNDKLELYNGLQGKIGVRIYL